MKIQDSHNGSSSLVESLEVTFDERDKNNQCIGYEVNLRI